MAMYAQVPPEMVGVDRSEARDQGGQVGESGRGAGPHGQHRRPPHSRRKMGTVIRDTLPLNEAAKREMARMPQKTPVTVLQELLARRGTVPKYELVQIEGMIHEPTFRYRVIVADIVAMGTGRSKKEAKHSAARALLNKLTGSPEEPESNANGTGANEQGAGGTGAIGVSYEDKPATNPVGCLQELCMSRLWPPPCYHTDPEEEINRSGLPHERQFTMVCVLMKQRAVGIGKSKKLAKRQAAYNMWQAMQQAPPGSGPIVSSDDNGPRVANVSRYTNLKDSKIATLTTSHSHKVSQFHKHLKHNIGEHLSRLQSVTLGNKDFNYVQYLQEIASEQSFEVTYVDIEERSVSGRAQCLVQLSTLPVAVCYGAGTSSAEAQASAAHNALEYLKIMTKK